MAHWTLLCADPPVRLDVDAGDNGPVQGTLTVGTATYPVSGSWAASGSVPGRNASAFSVSGAVSPAGSAAATFVAAAGIMDGPGPSPVQIALRVFVSSSGNGTMTSYDVVLLPPQPIAPSPWLLGFTSPDVQSPLGDGRPWGDGTAMSQRAYAGFPPWDTGNAVVPMVGGDVTLRAMCDAFEAAIADAASSSLPPGQRGHVYIADWQFNALRDLSANTKPWTKDQPGDKAQTALGLVCRMMAAGINVRLLLWMPTSVQARVAVGALAAEHWSVAAAVQDYNTVVQQQRFGLSQPLGVVALDLRTASPGSASLHQKMIAIRVGNVNVAFCGGVDLAFTRRDHGLAGSLSVGEGDWQSGGTVPLPSWWSSMTGTDYPLYPYPGSPLSGLFPEDLQADVYGTHAPGWRHWHDHHLRLTGPIVATLEQQFGERWIMDTGDRVYTFDRGSASIGNDNQVQLTSPASWSQGKVLPLPAAEACAPAGNSVVQMWRTIPLRPGVQASPFVRGEFTVTAGVANAIKQATQLITMWDQYFWSVPVALQLGAQLNANPNLSLLIVLPPYGTTSSQYELWYRRRALQALAQSLQPASRSRVRVMNMWSAALRTGVYVHAKCQTYDENLLVCGSANMNRRSTECDAELDCAVLDTSVVRAHLANLYACLTGQTWSQFTPGWLHDYWAGMAGKTSQTLVPDPFWAQVKNPATPNGVAMTCTAPGFFSHTENQVEPSSVGTPLPHLPLRPPLEQATCTLPGCTGDPGAPGRLDEVSFLLERCRQDPGTILSSEWPWRIPNADS
jgi:phosphatidylserine/phosphatidylglycerophosphate/cardiolipin synthase-like enzyme